jgi:hypothetical protein
MAQVIKIKRSSTTATPTSLNQGELAYSSEGTSNKLFIGNPGTGDVTVIGGKFFTDMLDHTAGTLTASSAIIVDANSKIDQLLVDNITIDGNTIGSSDTDGDLILTPNGNGNLVLEGVNWPQADGTAGYFLKTDGAGQTSWAEVVSNFTISDGSNTDTVNTGETLTFTGGTDITTTVSDNEVTITYSGETPAIYDNSGTPALETGITAAEVRTLLDVDQAGTDNSTDVTLAGSYDYLTISGQEISLDQIDLTTDVTGALPNANLANSTTTLGTTTLTLGSSESDLAGLTSLGVDNIIIDGTTITTDDASDLNLGDNAGVDVVVKGNLTVEGTTTTVNSTTVELGDNIIVLNKDATGTPTADAGIEVERGDASNVQLRWHETTDVWQVTTDGTTYSNLLTTANFETNITTIDGGTF